MNSTNNHTAFIPITQKSTVSIALMVIILTGIIGNVSMMFDLKSDVALVQRDVSHVIGDVNDIKVSLGQLGIETKSDIRQTHNEVSILRQKVSELAVRLENLERGK